MASVGCLVKTNNKNINPFYISTDIESSAALFVKKLFQEKLPRWAKYHTLDHTLETVEAVKEFAIHYKLSAKKIEILSLAGLFHDTGYIHGVKDHEEKSVKIAEDFLISQKYPADSLAEVAACIRATKLSFVPGTLLEFIIRDADLMSLGTPDYFKTNDLLKMEFEIREGVSMTETDWFRRSEKFLSAHRYHTEYAGNKFNSQLEQNLKELRKRLKQ